MMAKQIDLSTLVWKAAGPKPKEITYRFAERQFKKVPDAAGTFDTQFTNYTRRT